METLNLENARAFNASLKKAVLAATGQKVKVEVINSYNFPKCRVRVYAETSFSNEFRLRVFDACGKDRKSLSNQNDVCYGLIRESWIAAYIDEWQKVFG